MSKERWKATGKELGGAFQGLAKTMIRSAARGVENVEEWAEGSKNEQDPNGQAQDSTVFSDGSWKETGKGLGHAFSSLGKTLLNTGEEAADKAVDWADDTFKKNDPTE